MRWTRESCGGTKDFVAIYSLDLLMALCHSDDAISCPGETFCILSPQDAEFATLH